MCILIFPCSFLSFVTFFFTSFITLSFLLLFFHFYHSMFLSLLYMLYFCLLLFLPLTFLFLFVFFIHSFPCLSFILPTYCLQGNVGEDKLMSIQCTHYSVLNAPICLLKVKHSNMVEWSSSEGG